MYRSRHLVLVGKSVACICLNLYSIVIDYSLEGFLGAFERVPFCLTMEETYSVSPSKEYDYHHPTIAGRVSMNHRSPLLYLP